MLIKVMIIISLAYLVGYHSLVVSIRAMEIIYVNEEKVVIEY